MSAVTHSSGDRGLGTAHVRGRLAEVRERIAAACRRAGRQPAAVGVVAVTKTHPPAVVRTAIAAGLDDVGENRVQEMLDKMEALAGEEIRWHFVGRLQSNKARDVVGRTVLVHALDRRSLAEELSKRAAAAGVVQRTLVQVNVGDDPAKAGCEPGEVEDLVGSVRDLPNLAVEGLMTIPPLAPEDVDQGDASRPHFAHLREIRDRLRGTWPEVAHLSMGMSADFEAAVEEGATIVRLGTVLFGPRGDA